MKNKKILNNKGFSIMESMVTLLIVVIITLIVGVGTNTAYKAYYESMSHSQGQVLCSSISNAIRDEIRYAGTIHITEIGEIKSFFSNKFGELVITDFDGYDMFNVDEDGYARIADIKLLADATYDFTNKANVSVVYLRSTGCFRVVIEITNAYGTQVAHNTFDAKPINDGKIIVDVEEVGG